MKTKSIKLTININALPKIVFAAWLDSNKHGEMIGSDAQIDPVVGGKFQMWDGEIYGNFLEIDRKQFKIKADWLSKTGSWQKNEPSKLNLEFLPDDNGTKLILTQTDIPASEAEDVEEGWEEYYWKPMQKYFSKSS